MAQRIRSCTNNIGFDTINCDSYLNRLLKPEKPAVNKPGFISKCPRDRSASNVRSATGALVPTTASSLRSRPAYRPQTQPPSKPRNNPINFTHKELVADNTALVEVTVRTHSGRRARTGDGVENNREPWAKLLKPTKSGDALSSFGSFDPLRTVHFLAKELQSKLKLATPSNSKVLEMLSDMQHALNRVPPELAATICLQQGIENQQLKKSASEVQQYKNKPIVDQMEHPEKLAPIKPCMEDKMCQTSNNFASAAFQKQLEESTAKLEVSCKQMEMVCNQLRNEKEQVEHLLRAEMDTVTFLRKQIEELETEKIESSNLMLERLAKERNALQFQVKTLQAQVSSHHGPSLHELRSLVQEREMEKSVVEQENMSLRHKLTLSNMEKEKYMAILNVRDRQINEIKIEMNQLQEVVNDQLMELQKTPFMSSPSSQSTCTGTYNGTTRFKTQKNNNKYNTSKETGANDSPSSVNSNAPVQHLFTNDAMIHSFRELPSGDSSASHFECRSSKIMRNEQEANSAPKVSDSRSPCGSTSEKTSATGRAEPTSSGAQTNIRGMFTDLKRPSLSINTPLLTSSADHSQDPHRSNV